MLSRDRVILLAIALNKFINIRFAGELVKNKI